MGETLTVFAVHVIQRPIWAVKNMKASTHNVEVRGVSGPWVSADPGRAAGLHVDDGGPQAVDVCLGVVPSTQNQLWTHVHLKRTEQGSGKANLQASNTPSYFRGLRYDYS